jgi:hypothetical protein
MARLSTTLKSLGYPGTERQFRELLLEARHNLYPG